MSEQWNCDGSGPHASGTVRLLPFPNGNLILCCACHRREIDWRRRRNQQLPDDAKYALPRWEECEVYSP